jgi:hypothetical protein
MHKTDISSNDFFRLIAVFDEIDLGIEIEDGESERRIWERVIQ